MLQDNKLVLFFTLKNNLKDKITINNFSATLSNGEEAIGECYPKIVKSNSITSCKVEFKSKPTKEYEEARIAIDYNLDPPNIFVFYIIRGTVIAPVVQGAGIYMVTFNNNPNYAGVISVNGVILENGQSIPLRTGSYSIQAIPKTNYSFVQWTLRIINGNANLQSATQNPTNLFINGTVEVNATYIYTSFTTSTTSTTSTSSLTPSCGGCIERSAAPDICDNPPSFTCPPSCPLLQCVPVQDIFENYWCWQCVSTTTSTSTSTSTTSTTSIWMSDWKYRKPITIDNTRNSNTLSNYQVLVTLDTASLISAGKMRSDCGDIRFTDSDAQTQLSYWIESGCNSATTKIWVKVPSIPGSSTKTIYVYYGNPSATSQSNGYSTFLAFNLKWDGPINGGGLDTCALLSDGTAKCWGWNAYGQLGDGTTTDRYAPVSVVGLSNAIAISAGIMHTCALLSDGTVKCWGYNAYGELGDGTTTNRNTPVSVVGLSNAVAISTGDLHTCALLSDGTAKCWGSNAYGQLGVDPITYGTQSSTPVSVVGLSNAIAITAGGYHTCALLSSGSVKCWGWNYYGQLGDGTNTWKSTPVSVYGLSNVVSISGGKYHTCALLSDGTVKCWGYNADGELGDGTATNRYTPVSVSGLSNAIAISAGDYHTCALLKDGTVKCWGYNAYGELGDGTTTNRYTPVSVSGLSNVVSISAGGFHTCALLSDGTAKCWGSDGNGQLGDYWGAGTSHPTPVTVLNYNIGGKYDKTNGILTLQKSPQIDTYFIRAYTSPEPTTQVVGVEQSI
jgi:alpha-tubulin suppressor-like RCC1 family protein